MGHLTIAERVDADLERLRGMRRHSDLTMWARANGIDSRSGFGIFKKALRERGIDYDGMRLKGLQERELVRTSVVEREVTLCSAFAKGLNRFAVTGEYGEPLWFGDVRERVADEGEGQVNAALKAIWLASKIAEAASLRRLRLNLIVDAEWLTWSTERGQRAGRLRETAARYGIDLALQWRVGARNPAYDVATGKGFRAWQNNDLEGFARPAGMRSARREGA